MTTQVRHISPRSLAEQERRAKALRLKASGLNYPQIAEECGYYDRHSARRAVKLAMADIIIEPAKDLLKVELTTLDQLQAKAMAVAMRGDMNGVDKVLKVMQMRHQLLGIGKAESSDDDGKITEVIIDRSILMDKREAPVQGEIVEVDA